MCLHLECCGYAHSTASEVLFPVIIDVSGLTVVADRLRQAPAAVELVTGQEMLSSCRKISIQDRTRGNVGRHMLSYV